MKVLLPDYGLTYNTLLGLIPSKVKDDYRLEHNKDLNLLRVGFKSLGGPLDVSIPLDRVRMIKSDEVSLDIVAHNFYLTIFINVEYINLQVI
jgi:hypothetical protein